MKFLTAYFSFLFFLASSITLTASISMASKARLSSLGQDKNGSLLIDDERNIFLNPAYINNLKNSANFEFGKTNVGPDLITNTIANSPKAEGGMTYTLDSFVTAIQVGRVHRIVDSMFANRSLSTTGFFVPQNSLDLIIGKPGALNWGASLHYSKSSSETGQTAQFPDSQASIMSFSGGIYQPAYSVFASFDLVHKSETTESTGSPEKFEGKASYILGGSYNVNPLSRVSLLVSSYNFAFNNGAGLEGDSKSFQTSINYFRRLSGDKTFVFVTAGLARGERVISYVAAGSNNDKLATLSLPLSLGVEVPISGWLTLRSAVKQSVLIGESNQTNGLTDLTTNGTDDTVVSAGASLLFDRLAVDATLDGAESESGKVNGVTLLAKVGIKYSFE